MGERIMLSAEADLVPAHDPTGEKADLLDGRIGELSEFHATFGFDVDGVEAATALLPPSWHNRVIPFAPTDANGVIGWCLHPTDLLASKAVANRTKDHEFIDAAIRSRLAEANAVRVALDTMTNTTHPQQLNQAQRFMQRYRNLDNNTLDMSIDTSGLRDGAPAFDPSLFGFSLTTERAPLTNRHRRPPEPDSGLSL